MRLYEPYEILNVSAREEYVGVLTEYLSAHMAQLRDMRYTERGYVHMEYKIPTRGLIGFNAFFLRITRGDGVKSSIFTSYELMGGEIKSERGGVLVASERGVAVTYGLLNAQGRGSHLHRPGHKSVRRNDHRLPPPRRRYRNQRLQGEEADQYTLFNGRCRQRLNSTIRFSLEEAMAFISDDELVEITPQTLRLRKMALSALDRKRHRRDRTRTRD